MIKNNRDLYKMIEEIEEELVRSNQALKAEQLKRAMYISGHPGEILGELKLVLRDLLNNSNDISPFTKQAAEQAKSYIEKLIG